MPFSSAEQQGLGDLLTGYHFHIPSYQRGYAWSTAQFEALWNDLHAAARSTVQQHFTGIVLLRERAKPETALPEVELVDGQQRVISSMLLASALASQMSSPESFNGRQLPSSFKVKFADNSELQAYFDFWVRGSHDSAAQLGQECSSYAANIRNAAKYFLDRAKGLGKEEMVRLHLDTLLNRFRLFVLHADPAFDVHVAFETLNNRGKKLSQLELLKNRLIYLTDVLSGQHAEGVLSPDAGNVREQIHRVWKGLYTALGRNEATQHHDDELLRAHATAYFGNTRDADWLENVLLNEQFSITNATLTLADISSYVHNLEQAGVWWAHMHTPRSMPAAHRLQLDRISRAGFFYFKPLILAAYMRVSEEYPQVLGQPASHEATLRPIVELLQQIERFIVVVLILSGKPGHLGRADMNRRAQWLLRPGPADSQAGWPAMPTVSAIDAVRDFIKAYIDNREKEGSWTDSNFQWEGVYSALAVAEQIATRLRRDTGYYRWPFTKLLLLEYEESRRNGGNKPVLLKWSWDEFSFDKTVEHIYPQTDDADGYWKDVVPISGKSRTLRNAVVNSLGNLMLLSQSVNSSVSNRPFRLKNTSASKLAAYEVGSYSETQVAQVFGRRHWDVACIAARGVAMLKFAEERWSFQLSDTPDNYNSYLPFLFGEKADDVREGRAGGGRRIDGHAINRLVNELLGRASDRPLGQ